MSMHQASKPRRANQSIIDASGLPGIWKSNPGVDAIDEPCTNTSVPSLAASGVCFSHRKSFTSPLCVQCSWPAMAAFVWSMVLNRRRCGERLAAAVARTRRQFAAAHELDCAVLELGNFAERVERRVGQEAGRRLVIAERDGHRAARRAVVGARVQ